MILETGKVVAVEPSGLWVETIQRSACGSCQAQKGCGHSVLAKFGASASSLWVLLEGRDASQYQIGNEVQIGISEAVMANGSLFIYMIPLLMMIVATVIAHQQLLGDGLTALCAFMGLFTGAACVRFFSYLIPFDNRLRPVLIDVQAIDIKMAEQVIATCTLE